MLTKIELAQNFARQKHTGQKRKYTGEPYINHCRSVANQVAMVTTNEDMISAAWLHDTLEDTETTAMELEELFGPRVAKLVGELTDHYTSPSHGNRAERKQKECERLSKISPEAQTIKLADLIDNTKSIVERDLEFAKVYLKEKENVLKVLTKGDSGLYEMAMISLNQGLNKIAGVAQR